MQIDHALSFQHYNTQFMFAQSVHIMFLKKVARYFSAYFFRGHFHWLSRCHTPPCLTNPRILGIIVLNLVHKFPVGQGTASSCGLRVES